MKKLFLLCLCCVTSLLLLTGCGEVKLENSELMTKWYLNSNEYVYFLDDGILLQKGIVDSKTGEMIYAATIWANQNNGKVRFYFSSSSYYDCPILKDDNELLYIDVNGYKFYQDKSDPKPIVDDIIGKWESDIVDGYFLFLDDGTLVNKVLTPYEDYENAYNLELYAGTWNEVGGYYFLTVYDSESNPVEVTLERDGENLKYKGETPFTLTKIN